MKDDDDTITISKTEYYDLVVQAAWADALDFAGVDNWGGYENAKQIFKEMCAEQEKGEN